MNKAELLADLESKVIKVIKTQDPNTLNGGDKEYAIEVLAETSNNVCVERTIPIRVLNEGTAEEKAYYVSEPPTNRESVIAANLAQLKASGVITANDLSHLGIKFADLNRDGQRIFVTILNEKTEIIAGV